MAQIPGEQHESQILLLKSQIDSLLNEKQLNLQKINQLNEQYNGRQRRSDAGREKSAKRGWRDRSRDTLSRFDNWCKRKSNSRRNSETQGSKVKWGENETIESKN